MQMDRKPYEFPKLNIKAQYENIEDYKVEDFELNDYVCHESIKMDMRK